MSSKYWINQIKIKFLSIFSSRWISREWGTNKRGKVFMQDQIQQVWEKAQIIDAHSKDKFRKDVCGAKIQRTDYKNESSHYGWEIDHIKPVSEGGGDQLENLQPLQWRNNRSKGDEHSVNPKKYCRVTSDRNNFTLR